VVQFDHSEGFCYHLCDTGGYDDDVQNKVNRYQDDGDADGFFESAQENAAEQRQQDQGDDDLMAAEKWFQVRVLH
jgi:hypothetical protein